MATEACITKEPQGLGFFERYLTVWVLLCIAGGIVLGIANQHCPPPVEDLPGDGPAHEHVDARALCFRAGPRNQALVALILQDDMNPVCREDLGELGPKRARE